MRLNDNALLQEMVRFIVLFFWPLSLLIDLLIAPPRFFRVAWRLPVYSVLGPFGSIALTIRGMRARASSAAAEMRPVALRRASVVVLALVLLLLGTGLAMAFETRWADWYFPLLRWHRWVGIVLLPVYAAYLLLHLKRTVGGTRAILHVAFSVAFFAAVLFLNVNSRLSFAVLAAAVLSLFGWALFLRRLEGRSEEGKSRGGLVLNAWLLLLIGSGIYLIPSVNAAISTPFGNKFYLAHGPLALFGLPAAVFFFLHHIRRTPRTFPVWVQITSLATGVPLAAAILYQGFEKTFAGNIGTYRDQRLFASAAAATQFPDPHLSPPHEWWLAEMNEYESCRYCHVDATRQWEGSSHALSGRNILYRGVLQRLISSGRLNETALCQSCHQPALALLADRQEATSPAVMAADQGVSCKVCHLTYEIARPPRNGLIVFREEERIPGLLHPGDAYRPPPPENIRDDLRLHLKGFSNSQTFGSPEFCAECHRIEVPAHGTIAAFALPSPYDGSGGDRPPPCMECHMASDSLNGRGVAYPNHKWPGSNARWSALLATDLSDPIRKAVSKGDEETEDFLLGRGLRDVDRGVAATSPAFAIATRWAPAAPGTLTVEVVNARGGHPFPVGSPDLVENWLFVQARTPAGVIFTSGELDSHARLPAEARRFGVALLGADGGPLQHHDLTAISAVGERRLLMPGEVRSETYRLPAEKVAFPVEFTAELRYRRARQEFLDELFGPAALSLPVVRLAVTHCRMERPDGSLSCVYSDSTNSDPGLRTVHSP
jgi:hypothetical protein